MSEPARYPAFAARLRTAREAAGLTQGDITRALSLTQGVVSRWEAGRRRPRLEHLIALGRLCGVPWHELVTPEGYPDRGGIE